MGKEQLKSKIEEQQAVYSLSGIRTGSTWRKKLMKSHLSRISKRGVGYR